MDKIKKYATILKLEMEKQAAVPSANAPELKKHLVINETGTEFVLFSIGWWKRRFIHSVIFHFAIKNGKVILYANNTDLDLSDQLTEKGIPKSDIVLEFVPVLERDLEYAGAI